MLVCGNNAFLQIETSRKNTIISPPRNSHIDPSSLLSYSTHKCQTVYITQNGKSYGIGDNASGIISRSLPREKLTEFKEIIFKDPRGQRCKFISVFCGYEYTLYEVSDELDSTNFQLAYCYKDKDPNPLFLNIGNRKPLFLFGGSYTSAVVDTEGGIIIITESVFSSPNKKIDPLFLPNNDKPVKLACCDNFIIALGQSGSIYEINIRSHNPKFEKLSGQIVVDIAGINNFFFAVFKDGRVFGRGKNTYGQLGMPKGTEFVEEIIEIKSLNKYKIVSAFTGSFHSIFKTSEGKMVVCGGNNYGQLFIPPEGDIYNPVEVKICQGFNFCFTGSNSSVAILSNEIPKNAANKKIEKSTGITKPTTPTTLKTKTKMQPKLTVPKDLDELEDLRDEISNKNDEISKLKELLKRSEIRIKELEKESNEFSKFKESFKKSEIRIKELEKENSILKQMKKKDGDPKNENEYSLRILESNDIDNFKKVKKLGRGSTSEVFEVIEEVRRVLKVYDTEILRVSENDDDDDEGEPTINMDKLAIHSRMGVINKLNHPNIIKTYGFFFGDASHAPSIVLELVSFTAI